MLPITTRGDRCFRITIIFLIFIFLTSPMFSYTVQFKEQFYKLYHIHYNQYPDDIMENIYWLERAVEADFCNPLYALSHIKDKDDWEKYRNLLMMHINLKLVEQHLRLGSKWDKQVAYFYNAPWKEQNLKSLKTAETCYNAALYYWKEAQLWAEKANVRKFRFLFLTDVQAWEDERERIALGKLNYARTIERELARLDKVRSDFLAMDENTY
ncbi:MAG TPA: hypothetical protein GXZ47_08650 [Treponema sp.]|nr:hypothetical protein [Treponema sp.]